MADINLLPEDLRQKKRYKEPTHQDLEKKVWFEHMTPEIKKEKESAPGVSSRAAESQLPSDVESSPTPVFEPRVLSRPSLSPKREEEKQRAQKPVVLVHAPVSPHGKSEAEKKPKIPKSSFFDRMMSWFFVQRKGDTVHEEAEKKDEPLRTKAHNAYEEDNVPQKPKIVMEKAEVQTKERVKKGSLLAWFFGMWRQKGKSHPAGKDLLHMPKQVRRESGVKSREVPPLPAGEKEITYAHTQEWGRDKEAPHIRLEKEKKREHASEKLVNQKEPVLPKIKRPSLWSRLQLWWKGKLEKKHLQQVERERQQEIVKERERKEEELLRERRRHEEERILKEKREKEAQKKDAEEMQRRAEYEKKERERIAAERVAAEKHKEEKLLEEIEHLSSFQNEENGMVVPQKKTDTRSFVPPVLEKVERIEKEEPTHFIVQSTKKKDGVRRGLRGLFAFKDKSSKAVGARVKVELLTEEIIGEQKLRAQVLKMFFAVVIVAVLSLSIGGYYYYARRQAGFITETQKRQLTLLSKALDELTERRLVLERTFLIIQNIETLLQKRIDWPLFFEELESLTLREVYYTSMQVGDSYQIRLEARAKTLEDALTQIRVYKEAVDFIDSVETDEFNVVSEQIERIQSEEEGAVEGEAVIGEVPAVVVTKSYVSFPLILQLRKEWFEEQKRSSSITR